MSEIRYRKSSPEESHRWGAYLERRTAALWKQPRLRAGLQLGIFPAFTAQQSWTVEYKPARGEQAHARFARCDISLDYQRFLAMSPDDQACMQPEVERTTLTLEPAVLARVELELSTLSIPLVMTTAPWGTDGVGYRLHRRAGFNSARAEWWSRGPDNWQGLVSSFRALWSLLNEAAGRTAEDL